MSTVGKVVVAGASGVIGSAAVERFARSGWDVVAVSRRRPELSADMPFEHVAVDLTNGPDSAAALGRLGGVTHAVYTALAEQPGLVRGWRSREQMEANFGMFRNFLDPIAGSPDLRHLSFLQGTKAYGAHLHPIPVPARERNARDPHENFYWLQEDYVRACAADWAWTVFRPQTTFGGAVGTAMNIIPVLGVYAALCRHEGRPFAYPGGPSYLWQAVDARIVAAALEWACSAPGAVGEVFNITNGDVAEWRNLWPAIADALGVETGPEERREMATLLPAKADVWDDIVRSRGLRPLPLAALLGESHHATDFSLATGARRPPPPVIVSTIKLRQAGFGECLDTEDMFGFWLDELVRRGILPPPD
jgi:nucleoside-diphosphate-sugar epimerase